MKSQFKLLRALLAWSMLVLVTGCVDSFEPKVDQVDTNFVVVDGFINIRGVTSINLTRTFNLASKAAPPAEAGARVLIEAEDGRSFTLTERTPGMYTSAPLTLSTNTRYRLHFFTRAGLEYASDYTTAKVTPEIENLSWDTDSEGVRVYVSARDDNRQTTYYRWNYEETWEFTSAWQSVLEYVNFQFIPRRVNIFRCWRTSNTGAIRLFNTTRATQDVVANLPIVRVPRQSEKLLIKYSVLVKQYAQTPEEYAYWEELRKNTESIGTLFDPLPSQLTGNVRCLSDPSATAIGFVGAYSVAEKRLFVSRAELPRDWQPVNIAYTNCIAPDTVRLPNFALTFSRNALIPIEPYVVAGNGSPVEVLASTPECLDCRLRGSNVRPSFWQ